MAENLMEGLQREIQRNKALAQMYFDIGPAGMFGATMINVDIKAGEDAIVGDDVVAMVRAFEKLKGNND